MAYKSIAFIIFINQLEQSADRKTGFGTSMGFRGPWPAMGWHPLWKGGYSGETALSLVPSGGMIIAANACPMA